MFSSLTDSDDLHLCICICVFLVSSDNNSTTQAKIVLQCNLCILDLSLLCQSTQLPAQLSTLSQASGAERMTLGDEAAGGIDDPFATICVVSSVDQLTCFSLLAQSQGLVGDELVCREAIVQLDHLHIVWRDACLLVDVLGGLFGHVVANHLHHRLVCECCGQVGHHRHPDDLDRLSLQLVLDHKLLRAQDRSACTIACWTALQLGQGRKDHGAFRICAKLEPSLN